VDVVTTTGTQTLTGKTLSASNNTISNIAVSNFAASAIVTESGGINSSDNDTSVPTTAAVKDYVDTKPPLTWTEVTGTSQTASVNRGYITNNAGLVTITLPTTAAVGDTIKITGKGAGGWRLAQNSGETIHFGDQSTTTGTGGRLDSTHRYDCVELICITANNDWVVASSVGNIGMT
jgi:type IV secretory pathway VirJ component